MNETKMPAHNLIDALERKRASLGLTPPEPTMDLAEMAELQAQAALAEYDAANTMYAAPEWLDGTLTRRLASGDLSLVIPNERQLLRVN